MEKIENVEEAPDFVDVVKNLKEAMKLNIGSNYTEYTTKQLERFYKQIDSVTKKLPEGHPKKEALIKLSGTLRSLVSAIESWKKRGIDSAIHELKSLFKKQPSEESIDTHENLVMSEIESILN